MAHTAPPVSGRSWITTGSLDRQAFGTGLGGIETIDGRFLRGTVTIVVFWSLGCEASLLQLRRVQQLVDDVNNSDEPADLGNTSSLSNTDSETDSESDSDTDSETGVGRNAAKLVALAVHTPRFPFEDDEQRVRDTVDRHQLTLPVIHDPEFTTWNRFNPGGWPATVLIGKDQQTIGQQVGTDGNNLLAPAAELALAAPAPKPQRRFPFLSKPESQPAESDRTNKLRFKRQQSTSAAGDLAGQTEAVDLNAIDLVNKPEDEPKNSSDDQQLDSPTAVATHASGLVAVADTGNNRVLVGSLNDELQTFAPHLEIVDIDSPIGVAFAAESQLYVIERSSASVIAVDLDSGATMTVARDFVAPTALCTDQDGSVVVTDAGAEQLYRIVKTQPGEFLVGPIAGSGTTGFDDGPGAQATLAQPVGVARSQRGLVFCDAASSNIRLLSDDGFVTSVTDNDFFRWGLVDGPVHQARLQRPTGVAVLADGSIVIADTGNDRLRLLKNRRLTTLGVTGLNHPTGLATLGSRLILSADSGNDRILVVDPTTKQAWPLELTSPTETVSRLKRETKPVSA